MKTTLLLIALLLLPVSLPWAQLLLPWTEDKEIISVDTIIVTNYDFTQDGVSFVDCPKVFRIDIVGWEIDTTLYNVGGYLEYEDEYNPASLRILHRKRVQGYFQIDSTVILDTIPVFDTTVYVGER